MGPIGRKGALDFILIQREALNLEPSDVPIPHTDFQPNIIEYTKHTLANRMGYESRQ